MRGNGAWLTAREPQLRSDVFGGDLQKLFPIAEERWSDSAKLDAMLELLVLGGRSLPHALAMLIPPAWTDPTLDLDDDVRAFHEYHASLVEPWDGPAAILASDGVQVVATLDRNGLRPCRFVRTRDGLVVIASEVGVLDIPPSEIVEAGRLEPGRMLVADTLSGRLIRDGEVKRVAGRAASPTGSGSTRRSCSSPTSGRGRSRRCRPTSSHRLQSAFGYTAGGPPAADRRRWRATALNQSAQWATTRRWRRCPSDRSCSSAYFKQHFAQVTNPPIDPQREALVMSLRTTVGAIGNLLDETPEHCRRVAMPTPGAAERRAGEAAHARPRAVPARPRCRRCTRSPTAPAGLERAVDALCREASRRSGTARRS